MYNTRGKKRDAFGNTNPACAVATRQESEKAMSNSTNPGVSEPIGQDGGTGESNGRRSPYFLRSHRIMHAFTEDDARKNCENWVSSLTNVGPQKFSGDAFMRDEDDSQYSRQGKLDVDDPAVVDSGKENDSDSCSSSSLKERHSSKCIRLRDMKLTLRCEWKNCDHVTDSIEQFVLHVGQHIPQLELKINEEQEEVYVCLWSGCGFETDDCSEVVRHVNFHSYHTKIKCIGSKILRWSDVPPCTLSSLGRNLIPDLPESFICFWSECERVFNNSQVFFYHVQSHVLANPRGRFVKGGVSCNWRGCRSNFREVYKLGDHVRTHTQEKVVGCPVCGALFASNTKFLDHCRRQIPVEMQGYQCSHCSKLYPSERLLRDHMRLHINHYKCMYCDMTCPKPASLGVHIRYRHLDERPYACEFCEYRAKTSYDLKSHENSHTLGYLYCCDEEDCDFSCRSRYTLQKHFRKEHAGNDPPMYCCDICDKRFYRGAHLTKHLFEKHSFRWPSGHCRFRYKHDEDGYFRLQTVRYESLEVTQEMMQNEAANAILTEKDVKKRRFALSQVRTHSQDVPSFTVCEVNDGVAEGDDHGHSVNKCLPEPSFNSSVLIAIEELDESGNIISSKVIETDNSEVMITEKMRIIADGSKLNEGLLM